jgi:hypothetical protein
MFGRKASTRRLSRSASFGVQPAVPSGAATTLPPASPAAVTTRRDRAFSVESPGLVVVEDDEEERFVSVSQVHVLQARLNHLERQVDRDAAATAASADRFAAVFGELETLKGEAQRLAMRLADSLAQLQKQRGLLDELLVATPEQHRFASSSVKLRVGECVFHTSLSTLTKEGASMLAAMFSGKFALTPDADGCYFIDRDGSQFHLILNYLRASRLPPRDLSEARREELAEECVFYGLDRLAEVLRSQAARATAAREEDVAERNTMLNIQSIATSNYVQSVIASLAEVTHAAFRQMAADAELGNAETVLAFGPGQPFHDFFVGPDGHKQTLHIFLELLRQEGAPCALVPSASAANVVIRCSLLRSDKEICMEVLRSFKKMRGFARN